MPNFRKRTHWFVTGTVSSDCNGGAKAWSDAKCQSDVHLA
jgi:hypothetical protein